MVSCWMFQYGVTSVFFRAFGGSFVEALVYNPGSVLQSVMPDMKQIQNGYYVKVWTVKDSTDLEESRYFWRQCARYFDKAPEILTIPEYDAKTDSMRKTVGL